jgi:hypothetical protein
MMDTQELIERCRREEGEAWAELWQIIESVALRRIRRMLRQRRLDLSIADDVIQELYCYLQEDDLRRLRIFRGHTAAELRCFLRTLAVRFSQKWVQNVQHTRCRRREAEALHHLALCGAGRRTPQEVRATINKLESIMSPKDRARMWIIASRLYPEVGTGAADALAARQFSSRTLRQWRLKLSRKYAHLLEPTAAAWLSPDEERLGDGLEGGSQEAAPPGRGDGITDMVQPG